MCSAIGAFMVSDFSVGVIWRQCKDDGNSNGNYNRAGEASLAGIGCGAT
jgi:hypothetical protein